ncbi:I78 family peptidase inhibitor [Sphingomonas sp. KR1UV-12]|uniref:I78 family peptidase inhibitor n=1 Tax=Sphingomonas aurea TaxID=3063994 RepID=A0ABT9EHA9_9SPHN|nr:I78 family peptidase inhibitor [Sphingomonas sp. KR1UV-12]MDP1026161.1 I78 family peptidase inhibitor [Sphingomonas sp. KR1UV-12]
MKTPIIAGLLLAAGCAPVAPVEPPRGPCMVDEALRMRFVGTKFRMTMRETIQRAANARTARILRPDDAATMDYREDRLNILLDDGGQVDGLRCG